MPSGLNHFPWRLNRSQISQWWDGVHKNLQYQEQDEDSTQLFFFFFF